MPKHHTESKVAESDAVQPFVEGRKKVLSSVRVGLFLAIGSRNPMGLWMGKADEKSHRQPSNSFSNCDLSATSKSRFFHYRL